jgi:hypothetical protein
VDAAGLPGVLPSTSGAVDAAGVPTANFVPSDQVQALSSSFPLGHGIDALYLGLLAVAVAGLIGAGAVVVLGVRR